MRRVSIQDAHPQHLRFILLSTVIVALLGLAPAGVEAQIYEVAPDGASPSVAALADGRLVVVWSANDGSGGGIFFRFLQADATPLGVAARVNGATAGHQHSPKVAALDSGDFVVTWNDAARRGFARRFDSTGAAMTGDLLIAASDLLWDVTVAGVSDGGFVVVWTDRDGIYLHRFDEDGVPLDVRYDLFSVDVGKWWEPAIVRLASGDYLVVWVGFYYDLHLREDVYQIEARRVGADGVPAGATFAVTAPTTDVKSNPVVAAVPGGDWHFFWQRGDWPAERSRILTRRFDTAGSALGGPRLVHPETPANTETEPAALATPDGALVVYDESVRLRSVAVDTAGQPLGPPRDLYDPLLVEGRFVTGNDLVLSGDRPVAVWAMNEGAVMARRIPRFEPSVSPTPLFACVGDTREVTVQVEPRAIPASLSAPVTLSAIDGAPIAFDPATFVPPGTSTGTLANLDGPSVETLGIAVADAEDRHDLGLVLHVRQAPPAPSPALESPLGDEESVAPVFQWGYSGVEVGDTFELQVARDVAFTDLVAESEGPLFDPDGRWNDATSFRPPPLESERTYHWRVRRVNACGPGAWSTASFTTAADGVLVATSGVVDDLGTRLLSGWDLDIVSEDGDFVVASHSLLFLDPDYYYYSLLQREDVEIVGPAREPVSFRTPCSPQYPCLDRFSVSGDPKRREFILSWGPNGELAEGSVDDASLSSSQRVESRMYDDAVATDPATGRGVVVWYGNGGAKDRLHGQLVDPDGSFPGDVFPLAETFPIPDEPLGVAFDPATGDFLVVWETRDTPEGNDGDGWGLFGRRFAADATPRSDEFQVNVTAAGFQRSPAVAPAANGDFLVVWRSSESAGTDHDGWSIQGRRIGATGPVGAEFQVNSLTPLDQWKPSVAFDPISGHSLVAWRSGSSTGSDQDSWSIQARYLGPDHQPLGPDFQVNTDVEGQQYEPKVRVSSATGRFIVAWRDELTIRHRWLSVESPFLFVDGFESGDLSAWTP